MRCWPKPMRESKTLQGARNLASHWRNCEHTGRRTVVLLISDGLDTGSAQTLDSELAWLKRRSRKVLWLNPLLRFDAYAPLATGAAVLNQHVDGMLAIHNLSRLEELASAMTKLLQKN